MTTPSNPAGVLVGRTGAACGMVSVCILPSPMSSVTLTNLEKRYPAASSGSGGHHAVKGIDLSIADGEFVVLVGPSGCGKSTVLRMIAGLEAVTAGEIRIDGRVVNEVSPSARDIAMVFQSYALYPHMTVRKNMSVALELQKRPRGEIDSRVASAAKMLSIEELLERKPGQLSGGQRQRVAVGRAIVREPKVALFDEPLSNLDAKLRVAMRAELKSLHARLKTTSIYVTHDQEEAMTLGDRIVVMSNGVIQQCDTPLNVYRRPANRFVAAFIGMPPMNFFEGVVREDKEQLCFEIGERGGKERDAGQHSENGVFLPIAAQHVAALRRLIGQRVSLGLRPQSFSFEAGGFEASVRGKIRAIEPLGDLTDVSIDVGFAQIVARVPGFDDRRTGDVVPVGVKMSEAHFFEVGNEGRRILT